MRSICEILGAVIDREINTKAEAAAMLDLETSDEAARQQLAQAITRTAARYLSEAEAERITKMFDGGSE
jgi:hypothetical protein